MDVKHPVKPPISVKPQSFYFLMAFRLSHHPTQNIRGYKILHNRGIHIFKYKDIFSKTNMINYNISGLASEIAGTSLCLSDKKKTKTLLAI